MTSTKERILNLNDMGLGLVKTKLIIPLASWTK